jgi:hypothetical protein
MTGRPLRPRLVVLAIVGLLVGCLGVPHAAAASAATARPLVTGFNSTRLFGGPDRALAFARAQSAGATAYRFYVSWRDVAPGGKTKPAGFDPTNPADPGYGWQHVDEQVQTAVAHGLTPYLDLSIAPDWASDPDHSPAGVYAPDPVALGQFALAAARRYSGEFMGLPRVRAWEVWNEPNVSVFMQPLRQGNDLVAVDRYRDMVNEVAAAVHSVHADNQVVAGSLTPFGLDRPDLQAISPLTFMRALLQKPVAFDVWGAHPYTTGGPFHAAGNPDDVSLGDLGDMRRVLAAGVASGNVVHSGPVEFWITEFSWNSDPPDSSGVPIGVLGRFTSEALYQAWKSGVSLFTWYKLWDDSPDALELGTPGAGLYFDCPNGPACDPPKPNLVAFRFPFVAYPRGAKVSVWGRTPWGRRATVTIQQRVGRAWRTLGALRTDGSGIVAGRLSRRGGGALRARVGGQASLPFSLRPSAGES